MRRHEFITLLGGAAVWRMLISASENDTEYQSLLVTFGDELKKMGWGESRNVGIDYRWKAVDEKSRQRLVKELVALQPDLMLAQSTLTTAVLLQQTPTIPIIFFSVGDPVGEGFVAGLSRPGRNVTGFINMEASMCDKWVELLQRPPRLGEPQRSFGLFLSRAPQWASACSLHAAGNENRFPAHTERPRATRIYP